MFFHLWCAKPITTLAAFHTLESFANSIKTFFRFLRVRALRHIISVVVIGTRIIISTGNDRLRDLFGFKRSKVNETHQEFSEFHFAIFNIIGEAD